VRTPMQWSGDRNAGFSRADPSALYQPVILDPIYNYQAVNVEAQLRSPTSFLNWLRRLIQVRREHKVFGRGNLEFVTSRNRHVVAYTRSYQELHALIINNLSRFSQPVELDLSRFKGAAVVEMIGNVSFPTVGELPYLITLGPHGFYWLRIEMPGA
jgi:maltose alpha-D-glucosyltransferase/alpha-amylase